MSDDPDDAAARAAEQQREAVTAPPAVDRTGPQGGRALDDADVVERSLRNLGPGSDPTLPKADPASQAPQPPDPLVFPEAAAEHERQAQAAHDDAANAPDHAPIADTPPEDAHEAEAQRADEPPPA